MPPPVTNNKRFSQFTALTALPAPTFQPTDIVPLQRGELGQLGTTYFKATMQQIADYIGGGGGGFVWGAITGTLADQLDLQAALNAKANSSALAAVATTGAYSDLTGRPTIPTLTSQLTNDSGFITASALTPYLLSTTAAITYEQIITSGTTAQYWRGDKSWQTLNSAAVGLGNVNNTSDANKPVSTAQAAADAAVQAFAIQRANHTGTQLAATISDFAATVIASVLTGLSTASSAVVTAADSVLVAIGKLQAQVSLRAPIANPTFTGTVGGITATMVGLGNVNNTSDADKPVSTAQQTALDAKYGGTSTANFIPKATAANTLGNSIIREVGGNIGINSGAVAPQGLLTIGGVQSGNAGLEIVAGSGIVEQSYNRVGGVYTSLSYDASSFAWRPNGSASNAMTLNAAGDLSIKGDLAVEGDITAANLTGNAGTATALQTGRTIAITGDLAYTSPAFNGSGNVTAAGTLATVNSNVGSFGLAASVAQFTVNAKGLITGAVNVAISIAATAISDSTAAGRAMLTAATVAAQTALLDVFTTANKGLVPAPITSNTTDFLRRDGTWAAPAGGGAVAWGAITGTLSSQTDLQTALNGKLGTGAEAATVATINGRISQGTNVTITGAGTAASPYIINSTGGGGGGLTQAQVLARGLGA